MEWVCARSLNKTVLLELTVIISSTAFKNFVSHFIN